ncbi:MAG: toxin-antitoxin system HicB family antitoxin [Oscillospiraceae bacterium]|nr:toxin-antitoxin system HicB family antitoxin [Oscillospiraceae bacterium]
MTSEEFEKKLSALPAMEPDRIDRGMMAQAERINDGSKVDFEEYRQALEGASGRLVLRLPRSLHRELKKEAAAEGVSLNQYLVYTLSRRENRPGL